MVSVSDGSYSERDGIGAAAWIIESECGTQHYTGTCIVPGPASLQSAYRSELVGQLAIIERIHRLVKEYDIKEGAGIIACDGIVALERAN